MNGRTLVEAFMQNLGTELDLYQEFGDRLGLNREKAKQLLYELLWGKFSAPDDLCAKLGHPLGPVWYTHSAATEPDMTCRYCGENIG
jgi:hypothetical protein